MLFKFIWVAITALALYGCPGEEDPKDNKNKGALSLKSGGTAKIDGTDVKVTATVHKDDKAASGVKVVFTVKCGTEAAVSFPEATSGDDGVATAKKAAADIKGLDTTADGQKSLDLCTVTATLGDDTTAHTVRAEAKKDETPTDDKKMMGMVHTLTWGANTVVNCPNHWIYEVTETNGNLTDGSATKAPFSFGAGAEAAGKKILVLPKTTAAAAADQECDIGGTKIMGDTAAFSDTGVDCSANTNTCWTVNNGTITAAPDTTDHSANNAAAWTGIIKTDDKYVYHVFAG